MCEYFRVWCFLVNSRDMEKIDKIYTVGSLSKMHFQVLICQLTEKSAFPTVSVTCNTQKSQAAVTVALGADADGLIWNIPRRRQRIALSCRGLFPWNSVVVLRAKSHFETTDLCPGTPSMFYPDTAEGLIIWFSCHIGRLTSVIRSSEAVYSRYPFRAPSPCQSNLLLHGR